MDDILPPVLRLIALLVGLMLIVSACSGSDPAATVNGIPIERARLEALHESSAPVTDDEQASNLFLLILHQLVTAGAEEEFGVTVTKAELDAAFTARTGGLGADADLAGRDVTRSRVLLEAELDVIRGRLEEELVRSGGPGVDFESAYRDFLAVNSRACLIVLTLADTALGDEALAAAVERRVEDGEGLEAIFAAYPDETARFDLGCHSPLEHGMELAPVALDGELGRSYARRHETGGVYVAMVTERDAPTADEVRGEVVEFAIEKQGPEVFNQWAAELLIRAEVEVNDGIGSWEPAPGTGDLPTVVANTG